MSPTPSDTFLLSCFLDGQTEAAKEFKFERSNRWIEPHLNFLFKSNLMDFTSESND
jgi:hypothetical protein